MYKIEISEVHWDIFTVYIFLSNLFFKLQHHGRKLFRSIRDLFQARSIS